MEEVLSAGVGLTGGRWARLFLLDARLGALLDEKLDDGLVLEPLSSIKSRTAIRVCGIQIDTGLDDQLDCLEHQRLARVAISLNPGRAPTHSDGCHERRQHVGPMFV